MPTPNDSNIIETALNQQPASNAFFFKFKKQVAWRAGLAGLVALVMAVQANAQDVSQPSKEVAPTSSVQAADKPAVDAETKALHEKLAKYLSGTKWTGQFTMKGKNEPRTEQYEILSAEKAEIGDFWNLVARIKYGDHDATLPLPPIEIKFAGGTPVITVDNAFFPGFGNFDARVLIRKGQYAGTWAHIGGEGNGVGGHMFGTIEKMDPDEAQKKAEPAKAAGQNQPSKE